MSRDSHHRYLEKAALKEAQKAFGERGRSGTSLEDFLALRVQTVEPWKRIVAMLVGCGLVGFAVWALKVDLNLWVVVTFGLLGVVCVGFGIMGWKKPVEAVFEATAEILFRLVLELL